MEASSPTDPTRIARPNVHLDFMSWVSCTNWKWIRAIGFSTVFKLKGFVESPDDLSVAEVNDPGWQELLLHNPSTPSEYWLESLLSDLGLLTIIPPIPAKIYVPQRVDRGIRLYERKFIIPCFQGTRICNFSIKTGAATWYISAALASPAFQFSVLSYTIHKGSIQRFRMPSVETASLKVWVSSGKEIRRYSETLLPFSSLLS